MPVAWSFLLAQVLHPMQGPKEGAELEGAPALAPGAAGSLARQPLLLLRLLKVQRVALLRRKLQPPT